MKKVLILVFAFTLSLGAFAQHEGHDMEKKKPATGKKEQQMDMKKDHVMMHGGKMQMMKDGKEMPMDKRNDYGQRNNSDDRRDV